LGLAIAVAIAQKHQGILKVESQVGKGSIFTLEVKIVSFNT
jgi:two-component Ni(II)/redox sensor kinase NrsS